MLLQIANALTVADCSAIREAMTQDVWVSGSTTATGSAQAVKNNQQANPDHSITRGVLTKIERAILAHQPFLSAVRPSKISRMMINRYGPGMSYGNHVDAPYIDGQRTDLSFTLFLSDETAYDGGELVIDTVSHEDTIKGKAGDIVVYPSSYIHRVAPVQRGERIACIGWIKSRIRSAELRASLLEIEKVMADLVHINAPAEVHLRLSNVRNNLVRQFGE